MNKLYEQERIGNAYDKSSNKTGLTAQEGALDGDRIQSQMDRMGQDYAIC